MGQRRSIQGSRMLITGASQGIGHALAVLAAQNGAVAFWRRPGKSRSCVNWPNKCGRRGAFSKRSSPM